GPALGHFALRVSADLPEGFERPSPLPQDRAVIIDVSHSQSQETIAAEAALAYGILRDMEPSENFVLLACDSACQTFPSGGPAAKTPEQQERALAFLRGLRPGGSSDIAGSLVFAASLLKGREQARSIKQIILISDGQATSGDLSAETIAQRVRPALLP